MNFTLSGRRFAGVIRSSASRAAASRARASRSGSPRAKNGIAGHKQLRTGLDDGGDGVVSHAAVHFDLEIKLQIAAQIRETADLIRAKRG